MKVSIGSGGFRVIWLRLIGATKRSTGSLLPIRFEDHRYGLKVIRELGCYLRQALVALPARLRPSCSEQVTLDKRRATTSAHVLALHRLGGCAEIGQPLPDGRAT
jgi:hypothetical protein